MALTFRELHERVAQRVSAATGYEEAAQPLEVRLAPERGGLFSLSFDTVNAERARDKVGRVMDVEHEVEITLATRLAPKAQMASYLDSLDVEDKAIQALLNQSDDWQRDIRTRYVGSDRAKPASAEWVYSRVRFTMAHLVRM